MHAASIPTPAPLSQRLDALLWSLARPALVPGGVSTRTLVLIVVVAGAFYGAVMGSYALETTERLFVSLYSAIKMPILVFATAGLCLPVFFVFNTLAGLRADFKQSMRSILAGQAAFTITLASLAPITRLMYFSGVSHRGAILTNAVMFLMATCMAQTVLWRWYRPLRDKDARHAWMLWAWVTLYAFVGIQMGWMLRPFIGKPSAPVQFFRTEGFSNAYVEVLRLITGG